MTTKNYSLEKIPGRSSTKNVNVIKMKDPKIIDKGNIGKFLKSNINDKILINVLNHEKKPHSISKNNNQKNEKFVLQTETNVTNTNFNKNLIKL